MNTKKRLSPFSKEFYIEKGYSEEDAIIEAKSKRPTNKEYWMKKGYNEDEAIEQIKEFQRKNVKKLNEKKSKNPEMVTSRIEYWLKKGYSKDEAIQKLKERQTTNSINAIMDREKCTYNEAVLKRKDITNKWQTTLSEKPNEEILDINKKKALTRENFIKKHGYDIGNTLFDEYQKRIPEMRKKGFITLTKNNKQKNFSSKEANKFFMNLYIFARRLGIQRNEIYFGVNGSKEWFIRDEKDIYFYDFTIPKLNLIIEYNGIMFHPPIHILSESEKNKWKQLFSGLDADTVIKKDEYKKTLATNNDFDIFYIWSNDKLDEKTERFKDLIREKYEDTN